MLEKTSKITKSNRQPNTPMPTSCYGRSHRITESLKLEKTSKIIKSNRYPNTMMPTSSYERSHRILES